MKILCLILASDTLPEHVEFQILWKDIVNKHPDVDCYFYKGNPDLHQSTSLDGNTLWIKMQESLETVYEKTLRAFEYFVPILDNYDFVYRTNLSTFTSFPHMIEYCKDLPKQNCCAAVVGGVPYNGNSLHYQTSFPGGNGFLLSPDLVKRLVEERIPLVDQDDITIGVALRKWGIPIHQFARPEFLEPDRYMIINIELLPKADRYLHPKKLMFSYRFKTKNRTDDVKGMKRIMELFHV